MLSRIELMIASPTDAAKAIPINGESWGSVSSYQEQVDGCIDEEAGPRVDLAIDDFPISLIVGRNAVASYGLVSVGYLCRISLEAIVVDVLGVELVVETPFFVVGHWALLHA